MTAKVNPRAKTHIGRECHAALTPAAPIPTIRGDPRSLSPE